MGNNHDSLRLHLVARAVQLAVAARVGVGLALTRLRKSTAMGRPLTVTPHHPNDAFATIRIEEHFDVVTRHMPTKTFERGLDLANGQMERTRRVIQSREKDDVHLDGRQDLRQPAAEIPRSALRILKHFTQHGLDPD